MRFVYALIRRLYPSSFRDEWWPELERAAADHRTAARGRGLLWRWWTRVWLLWDLCSNLPGAWADALRQRSHSVDIEVRPGVVNTYVPSDRGASMLGMIRQDLHYALRLLRTAPWFYGAAILTLAVGMGATISLFSVVDGILLKPLAYPNEERLVHIQGSRSSRFGVSLPEHDLVTARVRALETTAAYQGWLLTLRDAEGSFTRVRGASVSANFFDLLDARPLRGRLFRPAERDGVPLVLNVAAWEQFFGARADAIGQVITIDTSTYTIVGVVEQGFIDPIAGPSSLGPFAWRADPPVFDQGRADAGWIGFWSIGRLRPGVTVEAAQSELAAVVSQARFGEYRSSIERLATFRDAMVRDVRPTLIALLAAVCLVLLIGCANVANLLFSRATVRSSEIALRTTLGASRSRIVSQLLMEGLLISALGAALGFVFALAGVRLMLRFMAQQLPRVDEIALDLRVVAFALGLSVVTALLFALAPAVQLSGPASAQRLRESGRGGTGSRSGRRLRHALVVVEMALAVVLLTGAGLLLRTFWHLQSIDPGFDAYGVSTVRINLPDFAFPSAQAQRNAVTATLGEVAATRGVSGAGAITDLPMSGAINSTSIRRSDRADARENRMSALVRAIQGDYFGVMNIPLRAGRSFNRNDREGNVEVALINEELARRLYGADHPLGQRLLVRGVEREIVGVVATVKEFTISGAPDATLYTPFEQEREGWMRSAITLVMRTQLDSVQLATQLRSAIRRANPAITVAAPRSMSGLVAADVAAPRARASLILVFATIAILLAGLGIGRVLTYTVSQRLPEIGVRLALGAEPKSIVRLVVGQSFQLTMVGVAIGAVGAALASTAIAQFLYGVQPLDPLAFALSSAILLTVAAAASWIPARRGARVDPATALR